MVQGMQKRPARAVPTPANQNGFAIRAFREKDGQTLQWLADAIPVSAPHMRNIENENRNASPEHLNLIAKALDVPVAALRRNPSNRVGA